MKSQKLLNIISISEQFKCLPSDVISIPKDDAYTRYCFDEACLYFLRRIENKETPHFAISKEEERKNPLLQKMLSGAY